MKEEVKSWIRPILNQIDLELSELKSWYLKKKKTVVNWNTDLKSSIIFHCSKLPNWVKVLTVSLPSLYILFDVKGFIEVLGFEYNEIIKSNGFWTFFTLIISAPIAFIIWYFRDQNITQQIENARKDTNLKEFQKLAEWVSGAHLIEDKIVSKTNKRITEKETIKEFSEPSKDLSILTYSKKDGAVGLQISAVYNLLPFFRGDHGESFKKPALNLLTSAWLAIQQKELINLKHFLSEKPNTLPEEELNRIKQNAKSPLGIAITRVLLSLNHNGEICLLEHKEIFPGVCLAGMDFHLLGIDKKVRLAFFNNLQCNEINLIGANLIGADLIEADLRRAYLRGAELIRADLSGAELIEADLRGASLIDADLKGAGLIEADLREADLRGADLRGADLIEADLRGADLRGADLRGADLRGADLRGANLRGANFTEANLTDVIGLDRAKNIETAIFDGAIGYPPE